MQLTAVSVDGISTHIAHKANVIQESSGSQETVVFIHGNPGPMDDWFPLMEEVSAFCSVFSMDLPGFGRADRPKQFDYSVAGYANFINTLLQQQGIGKAHVVLHDFGGPFGLSWVAQNPEKCASVSLINTGVLPGYTWHYFAKIWQTPVLGELWCLLTSPKLMRFALEKDNGAPLPKDFLDRISRYTDWGCKQAIIKLYRSAKDPDKLLGNIIEELKALNLPACVIWGENDPYLSVAYAEKQSLAFPKAEIHRIADSGHWPMVDAPNEVSDVLIPFLKKTVC